MVKRSARGTFTIKVKVSGRDAPVDVMPPRPGASGCVALKLGLDVGEDEVGDRYSIQFGPDSELKNSGAKLFRARRPALEGVCPGG